MQADTGTSYRVVIVDYGMGNIRSIENKIRRSGHQAVVSYKLNDIEKADKLILPGVGHFANGMRKLEERNLIPLLNERVIELKIPILGICLGMQLMTNFSEEGNVEGLKWFDATTEKFRLDDVRHKVPHIGWNSINRRKESRILQDVELDRSFYFVHSYHVVCRNNEDILTTTGYGYEFVSAIEKGNIYGTQFHPEKSHEWGEKILNNFLNL